MRTRKTLIAAALTAAMIGFGGSAAFAAEESGTDYVPDQYTDPTLGGSTASSQCVGDVPWINVSVKLTDPDNQATSNVAYLRMTDGSNVEDIKLGELDKNGNLTTTILWPGASTDGQGNATGWPGWALVDDNWVETSGNYAWTRGPITATIHVNPEISVPLSYPAASEACASPTALLSENPGEPGLAATGGAVPYLAAGIGVGALALGATLIARRRRATH
jgi:hypothetical protein